MKPLLLPSRFCETAILGALTLKLDIEPQRIDLLLVGAVVPQE